MRHLLCSLEVYLDRTWLTNETWRGCVQRCKKVGNRCSIAGGKLTESFYLRVENNFILRTCSEAETSCCVSGRHRRWLVVVNRPVVCCWRWMFWQKHGSVGFASYDKTVGQNEPHHVHMYILALHRGCWWDISFRSVLDWNRSRLVTGQNQI